MEEVSFLYKAFFNALRDPVFLIDVTKQTVVEANAAATGYSGYTPEEVRGLAAVCLFQPENKADLACLPDNLGSVNKRSGRTLRLIKKGGETALVDVQTIQIEGLSGKYLFVIVKPGDELSSEKIAPACDNRALPEAEDAYTLIGQSEAIRNVCRLIGAVAKTDATVLIQGESGTGKEIVANAIHTHSHRGLGPLVKVNCAAIAESLLESELFGHVKGAFTGAIRDRRGHFKQADGGTIVLDEIGSMSLAGQAKLLRVLQERSFEPVGSATSTSVNIRVLASTNAELVKTIAEGSFREDLYYRLNVFVIVMPPLRERKEDIPILAQHFLRKYNRVIGKSIRAIAPETLALMADYDWPGNVRELKNAIEHAVIVEKGAQVFPSSLPRNFAGSRQAEHERSANVSLREKLNLYEKQILLEALLRARGTKKQAAALLGIDPRNLPYLLHKHHLSDASGDRL
jgi:two-component system, NtrC family, response regulator AtoC